LLSYEEKEKGEKMKQGSKNMKRKCTQFF
jgi:hypothetical protein